MLRLDEVIEVHVCPDIRINNTTNTPNISAKGVAALSVGRRTLTSPATVILFKRAPDSECQFLPLTLVSTCQYEGPHNNDEKEIYRDAHSCYHLEIRQVQRVLLKRGLVGMLGIGALATGLASNQWTRQAQLQMVNLCEHTRVLHNVHGNAPATHRTVLE